MPLHNRWWFLIAITVLLTGISAAPALQGDQDRRFFNETGHWVEGDFLAFYDNTPNAARLFGYPITDAYEHPQVPGRTIQHFQRARLELDPNAPAGQRVSIAPLGNYMYADNPGQSAGIAVNNNACRQFIASNHSVCYAFLQFYDANQGATYFGEPLGDVEILDGRLVQYFEKARLEWHPENPSGQHVMLTDLGRLDFDQISGDDTKRKPSIEIPLVSPLTIKVHAFPEHPLLAPGEKQTVYVVVFDQNLQPVPDAQISIKLLLPGNQTLNLAPDGPTNRDGYTVVTFPVDDINPTDVVEIHVTASLRNGGPENATVARFRAWW